MWRLTALAVPSFHTHTHTPHISLVMCWASPDHHDESGLTRSAGRGTGNDVLHTKHGSEWLGLVETVPYKGLSKEAAFELKVKQGSATR